MTPNHVTRQVWKYILPVGDEVTNIRLPKTHRIVKVDIDTNSNCIALWVEIPVLETGIQNYNPESIERQLWEDGSQEQFRVVGTGQDIPTNPKPAPKTVGYRCTISHSASQAPCAACIPIPPVESVERAREWTYIDTAIDRDFGLVWHIYQLKGNNA